MNEAITGLLVGLFALPALAVVGVIGFAAQQDSMKRERAEEKQRRRQKRRKQQLIVDRSDPMYGALQQWEQSSHQESNFQYTTDSFHMVLHKHDVQLVQEVFRVTCSKKGVPYISSGSIFTLFETIKGGQLTDIKIGNFHVTRAEIRACQAKTIRTRLRTDIANWHHALSGPVYILEDDDGTPVDIPHTMHTVSLPGLPFENQSVPFMTGDRTDMTQMGRWHLKQNWHHILKLFETGSVTMPVLTCFGNEYNVANFYTHYANALRQVLQTHNYNMEMIFVCFGDVGDAAYQQFSTVFENGPGRISNNIVLLRYHTPMAVARLLCTSGRKTGVMHVDGDWADGGGTMKEAWLQRSQTESRPGPVFEQTTIIFQYGYSDQDEWWKRPEMTISPLT